MQWPPNIQPKSIAISNSASDMAYSFWISFEYENTFSQCIGCSDVQINHHADEVFGTIVLSRARRQDNGQIVVESGRVVIDKYVVPFKRWFVKNNEIIYVMGNE